MTNNTSMLLKAATAQYNTEYLKRLQKMIDAIYTKKEGAHARNNKLKKQKGLNYQMESDRINGILANSLLSQTHPNYTRLKNRANELSKLGALAFDRKIPE
jgi:hypothetical protein